MGVPNFFRACLIASKNEVLLNEAYLACALERYRAVHGDYPATLEALIPDFTLKLPRDLFDRQPLHYQALAPDNFRLYSVGWNRKDEGGQVDPKNYLEGDWVWSIPGWRRF